MALQPEKSRLEVVRQDGSTVYRLPAKGVHEGSAGLFGFCVFWNGCLIVFSFVIFGGIQPNVDIQVLAAVVIFWIVGIAMLIGSLYLAWQSAMIGVSEEGNLFIERKTIFGTSWTEFEPNEIESIAKGDSGLTVNNRTVRNLKIKAVGQPTVAMFSQLSDEELDWLVDELAVQLKLENVKQAVDTDLADLIRELRTKGIDIVTTDKQLTVNIEARDFEGARSLRMVSWPFLLLPIPVALILCCFRQINFPVFGILAFSVVCTMFGGLGLLICHAICSRSFEVTVSRSQLRVMRRGFMSDRDFCLNRNEVKSVSVKDSGVQVGNRNLPCLLIQGFQPERKFSLMTGWSETELQRLAHLIGGTVNSMSSN